MKMFLLVAMIPIAIVLFLVRCDGESPVKQATVVDSQQETTVVEKVQDTVKSTPAVVAPVEKVPQQTVITKKLVPEPAPIAKVIPSTKVKNDPSGVVLQTQETSTKSSDARAQERKERAAEHAAIAKEREAARAKKREERAASKEASNQETATDRAKVQAQRDEEAKKRERDRALRIKVNQELALQRAAEAKTDDTQNIRAQERKARDEKRANERAAADKKSQEARASVQAQRDEEAKKRERDRALRIKVDKELTEQKAAESTKVIEKKVTLPSQAIAQKKQSTTQAELLYKLALTKVAFTYNKTTLTAESKTTLSQAATLINENPHFHYNIQGHTDSTGNENYNLSLSQERAQSVKNYLITQGVDESLLSAKGFGSSQAIASNKTRVGRLANRRVVFKIVE